MQTEVPVLPVVCSAGQKSSNRKTNGGAGVSTTERAPYKNSVRMQCGSEPTRGAKNPVGQRIISAKMLRVKELQNQLTDAHYHLNELANENRLLKALQKRQDSALRRYEGTNAELPRIIHSHHEELKVLQVKYKRLKAQHKQTCDLLKEKENEVYTLQTQNKHLLQLSKDKNLGEREKLQVQVSDLNHRIEQQQDTIQTLNRKLTLESKSLKHQLHLEVTKHKETQKQLNDALDKLKNLEELLDNREKRLYHSGQLPAFNKRKALTSQSLTNLGLSHLVKSSSKSRDSQSDFKNKSLPKLPINDSSESKPSSSKTELSDTVPRTETMTSLQQVRKFRLQKSGSNRHHSDRALTDRIPFADEGDALKMHRSTMLNSSVPTDMHRLYDCLDSQELADEEIKNIMEKFEKNTLNHKYHASKDLVKEYSYSSDSDSDNENHKIQTVSPTSKSRDLHSKLVNGVIDSKSLHAEREQKNLKEQNPDQKLLYRRVHQVSEVKDTVSTSESESDGLKNEEEVDVRIERTEKIEIKRSHSKDYDDNQERLMSITKSWTKLQKKIEQEREMSGRQLRALDDDASEGEINKEEVPERLLRYFERSDNESDVEREISESHVKSRRGTFGLDHSHFTLDTQLAIKNGFSLNNESDLVTNGESSSRDGETPDISRRKSSDEIVEANITNIRDKNSHKLPAYEKSTRDYTEKRKSTDSDSEKINYNKEKLLAAMKAIDDNENIEFLPNQKTNQRSANSSNRSQVTENLYRGLPTHTRKRDDIIKDIFSDTKVDNKLRSGCSKLH